MTPEERTRQALDRAIKGIKVDGDAITVEIATNVLVQAIREAVHAERERCAGIALMIAKDAEMMYGFANTDRTLTKEYYVGRDDAARVIVKMITDKQ